MPALWFPYPVPGFAVDDALEHHFRRAAWIGRRANDGSLCSFRSILVAFLLGDDDVSRWFRTYLEHHGNRAALLRSVNLDDSGLADVAELESRDESPVVGRSDDVPWTISAIELLEHAVAEMRTHDARVLDTVHVMGAYASKGGGLSAEHEQQLASWGLERESLAHAFQSLRRSSARPQGHAFAEATTAEQLLATNTYSQNALAFIHRSLVPNERTRSLGFVDSEEIFFTVVTLGREDAKKKAKTSARLLFDLIHATTVTAESYLAMRLRRSKSLADAGRSELIAADLAGLVAKAREIAVRTTGDARIHARHLVVAMLVFSSPEGPSLAQRCITACGLLLPDVHDAFFAYVRKAHGDEDEEAWRAIFEGGRRPLRYLPGFSSDEVAREDRLGRMHEIEAFGSLVASRELRPPLSIGLFGDWGSGKSFFMEQMREQVVRLASSSEQGPSSQYCTRIAQITFNAWHYAEANLWPSLVEHIFTRLQDYLAERDESPQAVARLFGELETAKRLQEEAKQSRARAEKELEDARTYLEQVTREQEDHSSTLATELGKDLWKGLDPTNAKDPSVRAAVETASRLFGPRVVESTRQLKQALDGMRSGAERFRGVLAYVARSPRPARYLFWLGVVVVGVAVLFHYLAVWLGGLSMPARVAEIVTELTVSVGVLTNWLSARVGEAQHAFDALGPLDDWLDKRFRAEESKHAKAIADARTHAEAARAKVTEAAARVVTAEDHVNAAQRAIDEQRPARQLARFIQERVTSGDYDRHLGVIATIRRDFERLTDLLTRVREAQGSEVAGVPALPFVERIVLYVDDLDRCPAERVVDVLQAIHLLLAFRLFVVVVGVDARWVSRALLTRYPHLVDESATGAGENGATTHDYLEKIFQLPYWLPPMDGEGCRRLLTGLVDEGLAAPGPSTSRDMRMGDAGGARSVGDGGEAQENGVALVGREAVKDDQTNGGAARVPATTPPDLAASAPAPTRTAVEHAKLVIEPHERACIHELSEFIARSPRRAKRFLNVYRVLKAGLPPSEYASLVRTRGSSGDYKAVLTLLAVVTGAPLVSERLLGALSAANDSLQVTQFIDSLNGGHECDLPRALDALRRYVTLAGSDKTTVALLRKWRGVAARYSFGFQTNPRRGAASAVSATPAAPVAARSERAP